MTEARRTLKLVIYAEYFLPVVGGVQTALKFLAHGLAQWRPNGDAVGPDRVAVTLITQSEANGFDDAALPFIIVRRPGFLELVRMFRNADVIHLAGPCFVPLALSWLLRKPVVVEHHGYHAICPNGLLFHEPTRTQCPGHFMNGRYGECLRCAATSRGFLGSLRLLTLQFPRRWLCKRVAANIGISNHVVSRSKLPRIQSIYYGIEPARTPAGNALQKRSRPLEIGYVGRLVAEKGLPVLVEAAEMLARDGTEFQLTFIGDGPERSSLESMVDSVGLKRKVTFTGDLHGAALDETLRGVGVVVMPTLMEETAGLGVIEQMMRGGVVIVSDIGGLSEVVDGFGMRFPPGDARALYRCLKEIFASPDAALEMGRGARQYALERYTADRMTREHMSSYAEIMGH